MEMFQAPLKKAAAFRQRNLEKRGMLFSSTDNQQIKQGEKVRKILSHL
jgi:hypothetical protein